METFIHYLPALMFLSLAVVLFTGLPVGIAVGGIGLGFALIGMELDLFRVQQFGLIVNRIHGGIVENLVLVAVPMFVFMGAMLEVSGIAKDLLNCLQILLRRVPGGLALAVTLLGTILAAATGIIGASVVLLTLLAMPVMLQRQYAATLASGTIAASGTLGILIPPSIMLIVMADLLSISAGTLFVAAFIPGLLLAGLYAVYIMIVCARNPSLAPQPAEEDGPPDIRTLCWTLARGFVPVVALITLVLGSIIAGWATPTEASGVGAAGATLLAAMNGRLGFANLKNAIEKSAMTCAMLFFIFVGATAFSYVFRVLGGDHLVVEAMQSFELGSWGILAITMAVVFLLGFFFDWIEITLIVLPIFAPIIELLDFGGHVESQYLIYWFSILVAVNLQTSFLSPPFGFALFFVKGSAGDAVQTRDIYRGIIPFVALQVATLIAIMAFPAIALWLPNAVGN